MKYVFEHLYRNVFLKTAALKQSEFYGSESESETAVSSAIG